MIGHPTAAPRERGSRESHAKGRGGSRWKSLLEVFGLEVYLRPVPSIHHHLPPSVEGSQPPTASDGTNPVLMSQMRLDVLWVSPGNQAARGAGALNPVVHVVLFKVAGRAEGLG